MRILIFRHVPFEGAGHLAAVLQRRGIGFDYADLYRPGALAPRPVKYDGLVFLGGPMSVNDNLAYLRQEEQFIRDAVTRGIPVLGICLGAQLAAKALGAKVRRNPAKEIGWYELHFAPAAARDPLFRGLRTETVFHWHGETFDLPPGAELLASSFLCRNQAFRAGERVYGLQFHVEVTAEMVQDWQRQDANAGDMRAIASPIDAYQNAERLEALSDRVFGAWCDLMTPPAAPPESARRAKLEERLLRIGRPGMAVEPQVEPEPEIDTEPEPVAVTQALEEDADAEDGRDAVSSPDNPMCPRCGWKNTRISHTTTIIDTVLTIVSVKAFRCRACGRRFRAFCRRQ